MCNFGSNDLQRFVNTSRYKYSLRKCELAFLVRLIIRKSQTHRKQEPRLSFHPVCEKTKTKQKTPT